MAFFPPIRVVFNDDPDNVKTFKPWPFDVATLEREGEDHPRSNLIDSTLYLAWLASKRDGNTREYEEWAATVSDFDMLDADGNPVGDGEKADGTPDPTKAAPSPG